MKNKKLMILGASILQVPAIKKAKEMGIEVVVLDMNEQAIGFNYADKSLVISTIDIEKVVKAAEQEKIDGIMTLASDMPMRSVAAVCKQLGLIGIDEQTAINATNKAQMRECLKAHGVPVPKFYRVSNEQEYKSATKNFTDKFIVKPADNSGSRGVFLVQDLLDEQLVNEAYLYSKQYSRSGEVVVEEFMRGEEVSVETISIDGECHVIQITDKLTTGAPYFVEMGHSQPTKHDQSTVQKIKQVAKSAVNAIGIKNGPSHTEIIITEEGPKIVELGARLGGDCITTHLVPLSTGVDLVESCILIALGVKPDLQKKFDMASAIRYIPSHKGVLKSVLNIDSAMRVDGVKEVQIVKSVGEQLTEINSSTSRLGFVIAQSQTVGQAIEVCQRAIGKIKIEIE